MGTRCGSPATPSPSRHRWRELSRAWPGSTSTRPQRGLRWRGQRSVPPSREPAPPPGFRNPQPCSAYWGQKIDTSDSPKLYAPYAHPLPYDICGYKPAQLRGAYQLAGRVARGNDGSGVTLAIVDAYDSPTLLTDAQKYFRLNDPAHPLLTSQFTNLTPATVDDQ